MAPARVLVTQEVLNQLCEVVVLLLVVVALADSHKANIPLGNLHSCWLWLLQLHLEDQVTFFFIRILLLVLALLFLVTLGSAADFINFRDINVDQLDWHNNLTRLMLENDLLYFWNIVFKLICCVGGFDLRELFCFDDAGNSSIGTITSQNANVNMVLALGNSDLSILESKSSWEVLVKNGDLANSVITFQLILSLWVIKLNKEVKIWLPLFIVDNWDLDFHFLFSLSHGNHLVHFLVVFGSSSGIIDCSVAEAVLSLDLFLNDNVNGAITLGNRAVEALELDELV